MRTECGISGAGVEPRAGTPIVLVVEDHEDGAFLLGQLLGFMGYRPIVVGTGEEALRHLEDSVPSVILSDILLPEMDGYEFARRVRSNEAWNKIPLIAHTGLGWGVNRDDILAAGFDQVLVKPVPLNSLEDALGRATQTFVG
jgi:CheY-like chemotaxis protein